MKNVILMSVDMTVLDEKSILLSRVGLTTADQLIAAFQKILSMDVEYVILDQTNLMLPSTDIPEYDEAWQLGLRIVQQPSFKHVIFVLPEESEIRQDNLEFFSHNDISHKLSFADNIDSAKQLLSQLQG